LIHPSTNVKTRIPISFTDGHKRSIPPKREKVVYPEEEPVAKTSP
jgi:hypothetical protein